MSAVEIVLDASADLGEGPVWDAEQGCLWWVDITAQVVHRLDPRTGADTTTAVGQDVGVVVLRRSGGLLAGVRDGILTVSDDGSTTRFADLEPDVPGNRCNDGRCDSAGRFWVGTMASDGSDRTGTLYRVDPDATVTAMVTGLGTSNGLGWSLDDRTMYLIDTDEQAVDAFDFDGATGEIDARRRLVTVDEAHGSPDGMTVDADGFLWVALYGGAALHRYRPDGSLDQIVRLPVRQPTCPTFGGVGLDELYVTSARENLTPDQAAPVDGALLRVRPGARGLAPYRFAG